MAIYKKKILPEYFEAVKSGKKKFELRLNDFNIQEGDELLLEEWDPEKNAYTGRAITKKAGAIFRFKMEKLFWPEEEVKEKGLQIISLDVPEKEELRPKTGVGIMVFKDGKILLAKRKNAHGAGEYAFPGGHLEYMESFVDCARREIAEECGIKVKNIRFQLVANVIKYAPKHYTHIGLIADWENGEPQILEPEKQESWGWYGLNDLPGHIFEMARLQIEGYKSSINYYDAPEIPQGS